MGATVSDSDRRDQVADSKEAKKAGSDVDGLSGPEVPQYRASYPAHRWIRDSPLSNEAIFRQVCFDEFLFVLSLCMLISMACDLLELSSLVCF